MWREINLANKIKTTVRVNKIKHVTEATEKTQKDFYVLEGINGDKTGKFQIQTPEPIKGFKSGELIDVVISTSQMKIEDFGKTE